MEEASEAQAIELFLRKRKNVRKHTAILQLLERYDGTYTVGIDCPYSIIPGFGASLSNVYDLDNHRLTIVRWPTPESRQVRIKINNNLRGQYKSQEASIGNRNNLEKSFHSSEE